MNVKFGLLRTHIHLTRKDEGEYEEVLRCLTSSAFKINFSVFCVPCGIQLCNITKMEVGTNVRYYHQ
jgi:hypothetical protein